MVLTFRDYYIQQVNAEPIYENNSSSVESSNNRPNIKNIKYYKVSKEDYIKAMNTYDVDLNKFKAGVIEKKPSRPTYVKGAESGVYFKRASKKWCDEHKRNRTYDFVDIKIIPLLKHGKLYRTLTSDDDFKKLLYLVNENGNLKLNKEVLSILKPFLFKPETTVNEQFTNLAKTTNADVERIEKIKAKFKDDKELNKTFKNLVESIWDYFSSSIHKVYKKASIKKEEEVDLEDLEEEGLEITVFDKLLEEFCNDEYDETTEYEYDLKILNEQQTVLSFENFLIERY